MKKIFLTLDYELFFGGKSGTANRSLIEPVEKLLDILNRHGIKATFFIDSGYLVRLQALKGEYEVLEQEYQDVINQIEYLDKTGHSIQLHIHPHWEDSTFNGEEWVMDTSRYRLHDFSEKEIESIIYRYKKVLSDIVQDEIFAHRAGGWCIQPFEPLFRAFKKHNIWLDSTLFKDGKNSSETHYFNFENMPKNGEWNFESDPLKEESKGFFKEIPISAYRLSPLFFWKLVFFKKFGGAEHKVFGDGVAAGGSKFDKLRMLSRFTHSVVSIDGYKASFLQEAYSAFLNRLDEKHFVVIGHPKSMSDYSLKQLEKFIINSGREKFKTFKVFKNEI